MSRAATDSRAASRPAGGPSASPAAPIAVAPPEALYVHVPFCVSLCPYCDFVVVAGAAARGPRNRIGAYLLAVRRELELQADALDATWGGARPPLGSLYLGGGTPSLVAADDIADLVALVRGRFGLADGAEITLEANPGPDERGDAVALRAAGINRLSFGAQSLDDRELQRLGRRHRAADVADAVTEARRAGIGSIGLDLLYDIPGSSPATWSRTVDAALALDPDHLSLYALTLDDPDAEGLTGPSGDHLPVTDGARRWRTRARAAQDEERAALMYEAAVGRLATAGYDGYEISNWARPGHQSRHNLAYWERRPYAAAGPGAHAFDGTERRWNAARLDAYVEALTPRNGGPGHLPPGGRDRPTVAEAAAERVILGLRLARGIPASLASQPPLADHLGWARAAGLLVDVAGGRIALTTRGRLLSNELFARLV